MRSPAEEPPHTVESRVGSEEALSGWVESLPDVIFRAECTIDPPTIRPRAISRAVHPLTGYTAEELLADPDLGLAIVHPDDRRLLASNLRSQVWPPHTATLRLIRKDGTVIWVEVRTTLAREATADRLELCGSIRDVTTRREAEEELRRRACQLEAMYQVNAQLAAELELDELLQLVTTLATQLLGGDAGGLFLLRPDREVLELVQIANAPAELLGSSLAWGEGLCGQIWRTSESLLVNDFRGWEQRAGGPPYRDTVPVVGAPIVWGPEILGVLYVRARPGRLYSPSDADILRMFASQAACALRNARLFEAARCGNPPRIPDRSSTPNS